MVYLWRSGNNADESQTLGCKSEIRRTNTASMSLGETATTVPPEKLSGWMVWFVSGAELNYPPAPAPPDCGETKDGVMVSLNGDKTNICDWRMQP